ACAGSYHSYIRAMPDLDILRGITLRGSRARHIEEVRHGADIRMVTAGASSMRYQPVHRSTKYWSVGGVPSWPPDPPRQIDHLPGNLLGCAGVCGYDGSDDDDQRAQDLGGGIASRAPAWRCRCAHCAAGGP